VCFQIGVRGETSPYIGVDPTLELYIIDYSRFCPMLLFGAAVPVREGPAVPPTARDVLLLRLEEPLPQSPLCAVGGGGRFDLSRRGCSIFLFVSL